MCVNETEVSMLLGYRIGVTMPNFQIHLFAKACFLNSSLSNRRHYAQFLFLMFSSNPCFLNSPLSNRRHYAQFSNLSFRESKFSELFAIEYASLCPFFNFTFSRNPCFLNSLLSNKRHYAQFFQVPFGLQNRLSVRVTIANF